MIKQSLRKLGIVMAYAIGSIVALVAAAAVMAGDDDIGGLYDAIGQVESNNDDGAVGDGGRALGRYQIWRGYWQDAYDFDDSLGGRYKDVIEPQYARRVVMCYWRRYCPDALAHHDWETLARCHNGGPSGHKKSATATYWRRVSAAMVELQKRN